MVNWILELELSNVLWQCVTIATLLTMKCQDLKIFVNRLILNLVNVGSISKLKCNLLLQIGRAERSFYIILYGSVQVYLFQTLEI